MGGNGVQIVNTDNCSEVLNNMPFDNSEMLMLQKFIDDVYLGDRRILIINGNLPESVVLRKPPEGDFRGNLAMSGTASTETLNERDKEIASVISKDLLKQGIFIAGLDVVGGFLTEINITCPTCFKRIIRPDRRESCSKLRRPIRDNKNMKLKIYAFLLISFGLHVFVIAGLSFVTDENTFDKNVVSVNLNFSKFKELDSQLNFEITKKANGLDLGDKVESFNKKLLLKTKLQMLRIYMSVHGKDK